MKNFASAWQYWALLSAIFAALTAVFAKVGITQINSDMATFIRTIVILMAAALVVTILHEWQPIETIPNRTWVFLILSGLATGASWLCYFRALKLGEAARVAPVDKLSVVFVAIFSVVCLGEKLTVQAWLGVTLIAGGAILVALT